MTIVLRLSLNNVTKPQVYEYFSRYIVTCNKIVLFVFFNDLV